MELEARVSPFPRHHLSGHQMQTGASSPREAPVSGFPPPAAFADACNDKRETFSSHFDCVSSGGSMVGLMVTSSKRAYAIPRSASPGRTLCLTKSSACGRLWQFAHPRPLSLLQRGLAPRSKRKARAELRPARRQARLPHSRSLLLPGRER